MGSHWTLDTEKKGSLLNSQKYGDLIGLSKKTMQWRANMAVNDRFWFWCWCDDIHGERIIYFVFLSMFFQLNVSLLFSLCPERRTIVHVRASIRLNLFRCTFIHTSRPLFKAAYRTCRIYKKTSFDHDNLHTQTKSK